MDVLISIFILIGTLLIGIPVPFCFTATVMWMVGAGDYKITSLLPVGYSKMNTVALLAVPLFIMAGGLMERGKIAQPLVNLIRIFIGDRKSGIGTVAVVASAIFGSISGAAAATLSCIGSVLLPEMERSKYPLGLSAALLVNACPLGLLIPPSCIQIIYAWISYQSVLNCFLATIGPGIMLTILLCTVNAFLLRKHKDIVVAEPQPLSAKFAQAGSRLGGATPALLMPVIVLGGIYSGIMTPTEASGVAVLYAIPVGFWIYKGLNRENFIATLIKTSVTSGVVMCMLFVVMILSRIYVMEDLPATILAFLNSISDNKLVMLMMVNVFMVLIGMLMDDTSGTLLCTPVLLPVVTHLGIHPVQFAAILGVNLGMGLVTPPTAPMLYLGARVASCKVNRMLTPTFYMIIFAWIPTLILTTYWSPLSLFLPRFLLGADL
nr:TRAP transporter large permease [uncultured Desulfobacter sp.]